MIPTLQVALDFLELSRALDVAREAWKGGATWIEAGLTWWVEDMRPGPGVLADMRKRVRQGPPKP